MYIGETKTINFETTDSDWDFLRTNRVLFIIHVNKKEYIRFDRDDRDFAYRITVDPLDPKKASVFITRTQSLTLTTGMLGIEIYVQKNADEHATTLYFEVEKVNRPFTTNV